MGRQYANTVPFCVRDLNILGFCARERRVWEPVPYGYKKRWPIEGVQEAKPEHIVRGGASVGGVEGQARVSELL